MLLLIGLCGTYGGGIGRQGVGVGVGVSKVRRVLVDSANGGRVIASRQARDGQDRQQAL